MSYAAYGPSTVPLERGYQDFAPWYMVEWMVSGPWFYLIDDFGDAIPINGQSSFQ